MMNNAILSLVAIAVFNYIPLIGYSQCNFLNVAVPFSDTAIIQLYHPGFFMFGATENVGGFDNVCYWTISTMSGEIIHEAETSGDWESQSFMLFEHEISLDDSMLVELVLTSPLEDSDCCMKDTLVWVEEGILGQVWGNWDVLHINFGQDCETATPTNDLFCNTSPVLYPQPAKTHFRINHIPNTAIIVLHDLTGKYITEFAASESGDSFDIQSLPDGLYLVRVIDKRGILLRTLSLLKQS